MREILFSSGPVRKHPNWSFSRLNQALLGRSHRSVPAKAKLKDVIEKTRTLLEVPSDFRVAIMPGSATGAVEAALWNLLGSRPVVSHSVDVFSELWSRDVVDELKIPCQKITATYASFLSMQHDSTSDLLITLNGTTSGMMYPDLSWIQSEREGLVIADITSAAFCIPIDWEKIDVAAFSWQKGLGSEAAHGMLVLGPRAIERLLTYSPKWPIPRLFRLMNDGKLNEGLFDGLTLNTPSMISVEDCLSALLWAEDIGGCSALYERCHNNFKALKAVVDQTSLLSFSCDNSRYVSTVSPCLTVNAIDDLGASEKWQWLQEKALLLEKERKGFDILNHAFGIPGFRIWCGPTVDAIDVSHVMKAIVESLS